MFNMCVCVCVSVLCIYDDKDDSYSFGLGYEKRNELKTGYKTVYGSEVTLIVLNGPVVSGFCIQEKVYMKVTSESV